MTQTMIEPVVVADEDPRQLTNKALTEDLLATADEGSTLVEEPLDTGLWPTVELSEGAIRALVGAMHDIQRREDDRRRDRTE